MDKFDANSLTPQGHFAGVERHDVASLIPHPKNDYFSNEFKKNGNIYYAERNYRNALICYNQGLCFSEKGSENAGIIYGNRSAIAIEVKFYPECLKNIQLAREHNYPKKSLLKLMKREEKCRKMMSSTDSRNSYGNLLEFLCGPDVEPFMIDCLKIDHNKNGTPCLITNRDLKTGDLIAVQKPFSGIIENNSLYRLCSYCLNECVLVSIPCDECSSVMFCSKECKESTSEIHQYECGIIGFLKIEFGFNNSVQIYLCRALFKALSLFNGSAAKLKEFIEEPEASDKFTLDICNNEKQFLKALNSLEEMSDVESLENFLIFYPKMKKIMETTELRNFIISFTSKLSRITTVAKQIENERNGGFYPLQTVMNKSCAPNVLSFVLKDSKIVFIAQNPIKAGEKVTMGIKNCCTYIMETRNERQKEIFNNFQYKCVCVACERNYPKLEQQKFTSCLSVSAATVRMNKGEKLSGIDKFTMYKENCKYIDEHFDESPSKEISITMYNSLLLLQNSTSVKKII